MIYQVLIVSRTYGANGSPAICQSIAHFETRAEADICIKEFDGNSVISAFRINHEVES